MSIPLAAAPLAIEIFDAEGKPLPARVHLIDAADKPVKPAAVVYWNDHFVSDGSAQLDIAPGSYRYEIERGPEWKPATGTAEVAESGGEIRVRLQRRTNLRSEGWLSGDLHVHRPLEQVPLLMQAEDLDIAPVITWWNERNPWANRSIGDSLLRQTEDGRSYHIMGGEDERGGGALLYFGLNKPLHITDAQREYPSSAHYLQQAAEAGAWIDIEKPFWWDMPIWVASGKIHSIGLANNHMCRSSMYENEAWGRPRDASRLPPPRGNGYWSQELYYQLLEAGVRIPPSAGSASGVLPNPVGYNRVYVHLGEDRSYESWWEGLRAGRSFVTNGPLLRVRANGQLPGHEFAIASDNPAMIRIEATLDANDATGMIEVIHNGQVVASKPWTDGRFEGHIADLQAGQSGWFIVRAIADVPHTFRFASTGPFFITADAKPRISRRAAQFFLQWTRERAGYIDRTLMNESQRNEVRPYNDQAIQFWLNRVRDATAD